MDGFIQIVIIELRNYNIWMQIENKNIEVLIIQSKQEKI